MRHHNSSEALKSLDRETRYSEIISLLEKENIPMTRRQIKEALGYGDMDSVSPRITELIAEGTLEEAGSTFDFKTNKTVMLVKIRQQQLSLV